MVQKLYKDMNIRVENNGKSKASEVYVEIIFPDDIIILERDRFKNMKPPKNPIPKNIIKIAEDKYRKEKVMGLNPIRAFGVNLPNRDLYAMSSIFKNFNINSPQYSNYPQDTQFELDGNIITIKINSLLHTRERICDDFIMVPSKTGELKAIIKMICVEYEDKQVIEFPIIIDQLTTG